MISGEQNQGVKFDQKEIAARLKGTSIRLKELFVRKISTIHSDF